MHICLTPQRSLVLATALVLAPLALSAQAADDRVPGDEWTKDEPSQQQFPGSQWDSGEERPSEVRGLPDFRFPKNNVGEVERPPSQNPSSNLENSQNAPKQ
ncbi:hypothetical protein [Halochromatium salexigens]|uniref:hypothetical protein n=1 Tax=Halochromatium salexigens TaxID=49447 RepID=UPI001912D0E0|nr:hypothetical protein [Halochromatium salexigens]